MTSLLPTALGLLLQTTVLLGLGLLALWIARWHGPAVQTLIGRATLVGVTLSLLLAVPLTGHVRSLWRVSVPDGPPAPHSGGARGGAEAAATVTVTANPALPTGGTVPANAPPADFSPAAAFPAPPPRPNPPTPMPRTFPLRLLLLALAAAWGMGTALLLLWLGVCQWHLTRLRRQANPTASGLAAETLAELTPRPPALLTHPTVRSPFLAGLRRPAIFLPTSYDTDFNLAALRAILAHELAHLARRDNVWTLTTRLLTALLWPQPLLWLLCHRLEQIGEEACDEGVLAQDCPPHAYADCLLTLAERHPLRRREHALGAGVAPFRSSLGRRVQRILDKGTHAMPNVSARLRAAVAAITVAAAFGGLFLVSSAPAQTAQLAPALPGKPTLVGIWTGKSSPKATHDDTIVFDPEGDVAIVEERGTRVEYGRYAPSESSLMVTISRIEDNGRVVLKHTAPQSMSLTYAINGDLLTLHPKNAPTETARRVAAYPEGIAVEAVAAQQATRLGAKTPVPDLRQAEFLAGLTPVQGPGVVVTLDDSKKPFPNGLPPGMTPPNLIHDTDVNQVVNELKAAGAEAIAVNGERLVATSSIRNAGPTILINNTPQTPPFVIKAIGNPKTLAAVINMRGGIADQLKNFDPAMFSIRDGGTLTLPAYSGATTPRYARPASAAPDTARP